MLSSHKGNFLKSSFFFLFFLMILFYLGYVDYKILIEAQDQSLALFTKIHENLENSNTDTILIVLTLFMTIIPLFDGIKKMRKIGLTLKNVQFEYRTELFILFATFALILLKLMGFQLTSAVLFGYISIHFLIKTISTLFITKRGQKELIKNIKSTLYDEKNRIFEGKDDFIYKNYLVEMFRYSEKNEFGLCMNIIDNILTTFFFESYGVNYQAELFQHHENELFKGYYDIGHNHIQLLKLIRKIAYAFYSNENFIPKRELTYFDYYDFELMLESIKLRFAEICGKKYTINNKAFYQQVNVLLHEIMTVFMIEGIRVRQVSGVGEVLRDFYVLNLNDVCYEKPKEETCSKEKRINLYVSSFCLSYFTLIIDKHYYTETEDIEHIIEFLGILARPIDISTLKNSIQSWQQDELNIIEAHDIACVYGLDFFIDKNKINSDIAFYKTKMQYLIDYELNMKEILYRLIVGKR